MGSCLMGTEFVWQDEKISGGWLPRNVNALPLNWTLKAERDTSVVSYNGKFYVMWILL